LKSLEDEFLVELEKTKKYKISKINIKMYGNSLESREVKVKDFIDKYEDI